MAKFFNSDLADLAHQLTLSPHRLRVEQIMGIENLLAIVEPDRAYPFDFVCFHITHYRKRGPSTGASIPGKALIHDLVATAELISRKANVPARELRRPYKTHQQVAAELNVSTKTVRRWRDRGLMGIRVVFEDGVNRLAFLQQTVDRFVKQHKDIVARGASFTQLGKIEREQIVDRARELLAQRSLKMHTAAKILAEETGRAVETIRYTLRRYDEAHPDLPLFAGSAPSVQDERDAAIWRCHQAGEPTASIARAFDVPVAEIEKVFCRVQVLGWRQSSWAHIPDELFDAPNADALILEVAEPAPSQARSPKVPADVPAYLRSLYLTPLLSRDLERDLFRRYNYLKYKVARALAEIDLEEMTEEQFKRLKAVVSQVETIKQRVIQANLRLVVSIAKKHVGWSPNFFEVISDGNVSLMRAVEKFDFNRGTKFSTYATWAIVKNFARSIPEQHYHYTRYVTGQDEILASRADHRSAPASESDRTRIRELIAGSLGELDEREREIVAGHFGLGRKHGSLTLEQLGQRFGVTKERIRQIERKALTRLRELLAPSLADAVVD